MNFIPAQRVDGFARTDIGDFRFAAEGGESAPAGAVTLTIRPEQVRLNADDDNGNTVRGQIRERIYVGTYTRYKITLGRHEIEAIRSADLPGEIGPGDEVDVSFPAERIWIVPR